MQEALLNATHVAKNGRPDAQSMTEWADIICKHFSFFLLFFFTIVWICPSNFVMNNYILIPVMALNSSTDAEDTAGSCNGIPSHQHIQIWSRITGIINAVPQRDIIALNIRWKPAFHRSLRSLVAPMLIGQFQECCVVIFSYSLSVWTLDCRGSDIAPCEYPLKTHLFPVTSSVTFMDIPVNTGPPKTRWTLLSAVLALEGQLGDPSVQTTRLILPFPTGSRSPSQSMTVTGMMCVGLNSASLWPDITQVGNDFFCLLFQCFLEYN